MWPLCHIVIMCMCPGGVTHHILCYARASTKSVEKGMFSALRRRRRFPKKRGVFQLQVLFLTFRVLNYTFYFRRLGYKFTSVLSGPIVVCELYMLKLE